MIEHNENMKLLNELEILETQLFSLLPIIENYIEDDFKNLLIEFITHCECGLAFQDIIDTAIYFKIQITKEEYEKFIVAGKMMNLDSSSWEKLNDFVK